MRLLVTVLAVFVGGSLGQVRSSEREVSQGRITTGSRPSYQVDVSSGNPCSPSPCGPNTRCTVSPTGVAQCRCIDGYVPIDNTINGCKTQCDRHDDCPDDYRCSANKCVRVCVSGACGLNAECNARNHAPVCRCPRQYRGDPHTNCIHDEPEVRVQPPAPYVSPCQSSPCGLNANCKEQGERAVCSCPLGYEGDPLTNCIRGECIQNKDCPEHRVCQRLRCIDPCDSDICGISSECRTRSHQPICSCPTGYVGDAMIRCRQFDPRELCEPSPCGRNTNCKVRNDRAVCSCISNYIGDPLTGCRPECVQDSECGPNRACRNNICVNPCVDACGEGAYCNVRNSRAVCSCPEYYQGDPYSRCYAECTKHNDCPRSQSCSKFRCVDPCIGACGVDADCKVTDHQPICSCPRTHTGDPFKMCRPFTDADYCNPNPCGTNANCQLGYDDDNVKKAVCTCPVGYIGNPLLSCQSGDCVNNNECADHEACYNYQCKSPCFTTFGDSVCGDDAQCNVKNHVPVCSCPKGYSGDPLKSCYIDDRRYKSSGGYVFGRS